MSLSCVKFVFCFQKLCSIYNYIFSMFCWSFGIFMKRWLVFRLCFGFYCSVLSQIFELCTSGTLRESELTLVHTNASTSSEWHLALTSLWVFTSQEIVLCNGERRTHWANALVFNNLIMKPHLNWSKKFQHGDEQRSPARQQQPDSRSCELLTAVNRCASCLCPFPASCKLVGTQRIPNVIFLNQMICDS